MWQSPSGLRALGTAVLRGRAASRAHLSLRWRGERLGAQGAQRHLRAPQGAGLLARASRSSLWTNLCRGKGVSWVDLQGGSGWGQAEWSCAASGRAPPLPACKALGGVGSVGTPENNPHPCCPLTADEMEPGGIPKPVLWEGLCRGCCCLPRLSQSGTGAQPGSFLPQKPP